MTRAPRPDPGFWHGVRVAAALSLPIWGAIAYLVYRVVS